MKRIVITGGNGFLAGNIITALHEQHKLFATVRSKNFVDDIIPFEAIDLKEEKEMCYFIKEMKPEYLIHTAAISSNEVCEKDLQYSNFVNVESVKYLVDACSKRKSKIIFISTDLVFHGEQAPYAEGDQLKPKMIYGKQKMMAEQIVADYLHHLILRIPLMYGTGKYNHKGMLHQLIDSIKQEKEVPLFYDEFRSPLYTVDLVHALNLLMDRDEVGCFHVAGTERISRYALGKKIAEAFDLNTDFCIEKGQKDLRLDIIRPKDVCLNIDKISALLFKPNSIDQNLKKIARSYTLNESN